MSNIDKVKSMIEHLSQKIDNMMEELDAKLYEKNTCEVNLNERVKNSIDAKVEIQIEELYEKLYKKNIDMNVERNIYEIQHSKLMDLLNAKFEHFEQKFEGLLREPKCNDKMEIYDLTPRTSTTPTFSSTASTTSSSTSTCSTKHQKKIPLF